MSLISTLLLSKDLFVEKKRAAWKDVQQAEARCDLAPDKVQISYRILFSESSHFLEKSHSMAGR